MIRPQDYVFQEAPGLEQRLAELQAQIDRLTISLQLWRDGQERTTPADERLSRFADDAAEILHEWSALGDRHARAVDALEQQVASFGLAESRLQQQSAERFRTLERMVQQEWATLRQLQLEPAAGQRDQVVALTEACVAAASTPRASSATPDPLLPDELELHAQLAAVMVAPAQRPPQVAPTPAVVAPVPQPVAPLVPATEPAVPDTPAPSAASIGNRASSWGDLDTLAAPDAPVTTVAPRTARATASAGSTSAKKSDEGTATSSPSELALLRADFGGRITALQLRLDEAEARALASLEEQRRVTGRLTLIIALLVVVLAGGTWWAMQLQRQLLATSTRVTQVEQQSAHALKDAADDLAAARAQIEAASSEARRVATESATIGAVLAAPDLVRYGLLASDGSSASAQLLWSRSRGLVFSAARLGALYPESTYQLWLLTVDGATSAGTLAPDDTGRATLVLADPPRLPRPVVGVSLTIEPASGAPQPSERIVASSRVARQAP